MRHLAHGQVRPATDALLGACGAAINAKPLLEEGIRVAAIAVDLPTKVIPGVAYAVRRPPASSGVSA